VIDGPFQMGVGEMLVLLSAVGWACPTPESPDGAPCDAWGAVRATTLNGGTGIRPLSEDAPLLFYVHPAAQASWEDSLVVAASLDGAAIDPGIELEVDAPIVRLWLDVPVGTELEVTFDRMTSSETTPTTLPIVIEETGIPTGASAIDFSRLSAVNLCGLHTWVAEDRWADRPVLVQPVGAGGVPTLQSGFEDLVVEMAADSIDTCEALAGRPADLLIWTVDSQGALAGPVLLPWPVEAADPAPAPAVPRASGCSTSAVPPGLAPLAVLLLVASRRRR
jgi:MYXO-CTERM domain-containing protein